MSTSQIDLSIVIPAYKEGAELGNRLETLEQFLDGKHYGRVEVVVVLQSDDGSDREIKTLETRKFKNIRIMSFGKRAGKGGAVRTGMLEAKGAYRMFMDADLATPLKHFDDLASFMACETDVVIGVRDLMHIHKGLKRKLITKVGNILAQSILLMHIKDTQCGFKMFRADAAKKIFTNLTISGWGFDVEVLALARLCGYKIQTLEVKDWKDPKTTGLAGDSLLGAAVSTLKEILQIRWNLITGKYHLDFTPAVRQFQVERSDRVSGL
jgi:dolichyl-phosphate beta-glucosyltransferase